MSADHPQHDEVKRLLVHLIASGFMLVDVDDGGETHETPDVATALPHILGVDESHLRVCRKETPNHWHWIFIVLGNGPGELVNDHADVQPLRGCIEAWSEEEDKRAIGLSLGRRYIVMVHPSGCHIIEGQSVPLADYAALLTTWAKDGEPGDEVVCSSDLPSALTKRGGYNVISVVGRRSQLDALKATLK